MSRARSRRGPVLLLVALAAAALTLADAARAGPRGTTTYGDRKVSHKEAQRIELGRRLFFDPLVSRSGQRSCASCHDPEHGFSDPFIVSEDDIGTTVRHSQTILDSHLNPSAHWDGEFPSIEALVTARIGLPSGTQGSGGHGAPIATPGLSGPVATPFGPGGGRRGGGGYGPPPSSPPPPPPGSGTPDAPPTREPQDTGRPDTDITPSAARKPFDPTRLVELPRVQDVLEDAGRYASAFRAAFGSESVTTARIAQAVAAYCRSVRSTEAAYDRFAQGDAKALSASARRGLALFRGKAGCVQCHTLSRKGTARTPLTDFAFHNTGIAWLGLPEEKKTALRRSDELRLLDRGRERISRRGRDLRAFKTATLRDLVRRGPYMHTGRFPDLEAVIRYYAAGGSDDPRKDERLRGFEISDAEVQDLIAFLECLTGDEQPGRAPAAWSVRPERTRLRFVDASGKPLPRLEVSLHPVGDTLPGAHDRTDRRLRCTTDEKGWIEYTPPNRTHMHVRLGHHLVLSQGDLVPDVCDRAVVTVPVKGRTTLMLRVEKDKPAPETLVVEHLDTLVLPGHEPPTTKLARRENLVMGGVRVVRYEGWFRTDVPAKVLVRVPNQRAHTERERTLTLASGGVVTLDLTP